MDLTALVAVLQSLGFGSYLSYLLAAVAIAAVLAAVLPPATATSPRWWRIFREVLDWCAANRGNASNAITPATTAPPTSGAGPSPDSLTDRLGAKP